MIDLTVQPNGQKIKALRKALKWSQDDLAREAVCSKRTVENAEAGKRVRESSLNDIAAALGVAVCELICEDRPTPPTGEGEATSSTRLLLDEKDRPQPEGKDQSSPRPRIYRCTAKLSELRALGDDGRVTELTSCYYYGEIENATLTIRGTKAQLILDNVTMYDDPSCSKEFERSSHRLQGHGPVVKGSVNIRYTAKDQTQGRSWAGVCVLSFPATGMIQGYWMTAGHIDRGITVLGRIELVQKAPQSLVAKSSEEASGHD
jgi:transcriptional regulator with XRE-family HTH domain